MKYLASILLGVIVGAVLFVLGMYFNPFAEQLTVSPLSVSSDEQLELTFTAVPGDMILYTDHGESRIRTHPNRVAELWEATIVDTRIFVTVLNDARGDQAGIGIKFLTDSEQTSLINSNILVNSAWHIYLPGEGTLFIDQIEDYWSYLREIVVPARWSSGDAWRGQFVRIMTQGPLALGTARVTGGTGVFAGESGEAVETLTARAYSVTGGLVSATGRLTISLPQSEAATR